VVGKSWKKVPTVKETAVKETAVRETAVKEVKGTVYS
jgi:hypothetical protein